MKELIGRTLANYQILEKLGVGGMGEVWLVDLGLAAKIRPALVMSIPSGDEDGYNAEV